MRKSMDEQDMDIHQASLPDLTNTYILPIWRYLGASAGVLSRLWRVDTGHNNGYYKAA